MGNSILGKLNLGRNKSDNFKYVEKFGWLEGKISLESMPKYFNKKSVKKLNVLVYDDEELEGWHKKNIEYIKNYFDNIYEKILKAIYDDNNSGSGEYELYDEKIDDYVKAEFKNLEEIHKELKLNNIILPSKSFVENNKINERVFFGIGFECGWNEEHGFGALIYNGEVIEIGEETITFMEWEARDAIKKKQTERKTDILLKV